MLLSSDFWSWPRCVDTDSLFICSRWAVSQSGWHTPESWDKKRYSAGLRWGSLKLSQTHWMVGERIHKMAYLWFEHVWTCLNMAIFPAESNGVPSFSYSSMHTTFRHAQIQMIGSDRSQAIWRKELGHNHQTRSRLHIIYIYNIKWLYPFIFSLSIYIYIIYMYIIPIIYNISYDHMAHILFQPGILCYSPQCDLCQDPKVLTIFDQYPEWVQMSSTCHRGCVLRFVFLSIWWSYLLEKYWINIEWFGASPLFV